MKQSLYGTPEMVKQFRQTHLKKNRELPDFLETLEMMKQEGALSKTALPLPSLDGQMSKEAFMAAYDQIPFDAQRILDNEKILQQKKESRANFLSDRDVVCVQHIHDYGYRQQPAYNLFAVTYVFSGTCSLQFGDKQALLKEGDLCIVTPWLSHAIHTSPDSFAFEVLINADSFNVIFNDFLTTHSSLSDFFQNAILRKEQNYCVIYGEKDDRELLSYLQSLAHECAVGEVYTNTCAVSLMKLFLGRAFRKYGATMEVHQSNVHKRKLDADSVSGYIRSNYLSVTLEQAAEYFHYNKSYLSRFIRSCFGKTFTDLVTELRLDQAREYLRGTAKSISDIAMLTGYASTDHFSRMFRKYTGVSPGTYRAQHQR